MLYVYQGLLEIRTALTREKAWLQPIFALFFFFLATVTCRPGSPRLRG